MFVSNKANKKPSSYENVSKRISEAKQLTTIGGIYSLSPKPKTIYIGETNNLHRRITEHDRDMMLDEHVNEGLQKHFNEKGTFPEITILMELKQEPNESPSEYKNRLRKWEKWHIEFFKGAGYEILNY